MNTYLKRIGRKPLIFILYIILSAVGIYSISYINHDIKNIREEYKDIKSKTKIQCRILSSSGSHENNRIVPEIGNLILNLNEVNKAYAEAFAQAKISTKDGQTAVGVYATNDIEIFALKNNITIENKNPSNTKDIVYVNKNFLKKNQLSGNSKLKMFTEGFDLDGKRKDPLIDLTVNTDLDFTKSNFSENIVIISNKLFFDKDLFLHSKGLEEFFGHYTKIEFEINDKYNDDFERIEKEIKSILNKDYILYSTSRDYYNVIQPLKDKINLQEKLLLITKISLIILTSLISFLLINREKEEILIRRIFGESGIKILLTVFKNTISLLFLSQLLIYLLLKQLIEVDILLLLQYLPLNITVIIIYLILITRKKLIKLYQEFGA